MNCAPHWTAYVTALGTPLIALIGAGFGGLIAYRQWRTARNKLKLDLFDRRFALYEATLKMISSVMVEGRVRDDELNQFTRATRAAKWLLNPEIAHYLDKELRHKMIRQKTIEAELEGVPVGEKRTAMVAEESEITTWLYEQFEHVDSLFAEFIKLEH